MALQKVSLNEVRLLLREYIRKNSRLGILFSEYSKTGVLTSLAEQGTAPFSVKSTTLVPNLNAQFLGGFSSSDFVKISEIGGGTVGESIDDRVADLLQDSPGISWDYQDASGTLTPIIDSSVLTPDHGNLVGLSDDDHTQYARTDGSRTITGEQTFASGIVVDTSGVVSGDFRVGGDVHATTFYGDGSKLDGIILDHGGLTGLADDDHPQYSRTDGTRNIEGPQIFKDDVTVSGTLTIPAAASSGFVLTADAFGNASWQANAADSELNREEHIATTGQTVFSLGFSYPLDGKSLHVYVNGLLMRPGVGEDYLETDSTTVTFNTGRKAGANVVFELLSGASVIFGDADSVDGFHASQSYVGNNVIATQADGTFASGMTIDGTIFADAFSSTSPLRIQTGGVTRMFVDDSTGFVGFGGNESPNAQLDLGSGGLMIGEISSPPTPPSGQVLLYVDNTGNLFSKDSSGSSSSAGSAVTFVKDFFTVTNPGTKDYTLSSSPRTDSELVTMNGVGLSEGSSNDYTVSGSTVTINSGVELTVGDQIQVTYAL